LPFPCNPLLFLARGFGSVLLRDLPLPGLLALTLLVELALELLLSLNPLSLQLLLLLLCLPRLDPQPQVCRGLVVGHPRLLVRLGLLFARQLRDGLLEAQGVDTVLQHPGLVLVRRNFPGILFERELVRLEQRPAELLSEALCGCLLAEGLEIQPRCLVGMDDRETDKANGQAKRNAAEREKRSHASGRARWIIGHGCPLSMGMGRRNRRTGRTPVRRCSTRH